MITISTKFKAESAVISPEDTVFIYLATDDSISDLTFKIELDYPMEIIQALQSIYSILIPSNIPIPSDHTEYNVWLSNEILHRVARRTGMDENIDEVKKEDYDTIINRRDDLLVRVRAQMAHLNKVKHLIPIVKRRQKLLWGEYAFPWLALTSNHLSLTTTNRGSTSILYINNDNPIFYTGFVEFSIPFYEALDASHQNKITISNISPTRKHKLSVPKLLRYSPSDLRIIQQDQILQYLVKTKNIGRTVELERVELFDLLSRLRIFDSNTILRISITSGSKRTSIKLKGVNVVMKLARKIQPIEFSCPLHLLQTVIPITYLVSSFSITSTYLGVVFWIKTPHFILSKSYIPSSSNILFDLIIMHTNISSISENSTLTKLVSNNELQTDESDKNIIPLLLSGKIGYNSITNSIYNMGKYSLDLPKIDASPHMANLISDLIKRSKYQFSLEYNNHRVEIMIADLLRSSCSCKRICVYLKSVLHNLLEDRGYV